MGQTITFGIAAGVVTAIFFGAVITGLPLAMLLYLFTPLPALAAGLWRGPAAALFAAAAAAMLLALAAHPVLALTYAAIFGLPCVLAIALLARSGASSAMGESRMLGLTVLMAGAFGAANVLVIGPDEASYRDTLKQVFDHFQSQLGGLTGKPMPAEESALVLELMTKILPAAGAVSWLVIMLGNLWIAGRTAAGRVGSIGAWPKTPLELPSWMPATFMASLALTYFTQGQTALLASAFAAAHGAGYVLQGLALIHGLTRGRPLRPLLLILTYVALAVAGYYVAFLIITFALAAPVLGFDRRPPASAPPLSNNTPT